MLYFLFICGILLLILSVYSLFKIEKSKDNPNYKKAKIATWIVIIIGAIFIIIPRSVWKVEKTRAEKEANNLTINWKINISDGLVADEQTLKQLLTSFTERTIPMLKKYPNCIESATAIISQYNLNDKYQLYRQEEYGWGTEIQINIKIKDDDVVRDEKYLLSGHTLWYFIGAGKHPGIECLKSESAIFIGVDKLKIIDGVNTFVPVPEYRIIDQLIK